MAKNGPKTCKTIQNYRGGVNSRMPARAKTTAYSNGDNQVGVMNAPSVLNGRYPIRKTALPELRT